MKKIILSILTILAIGILFSYPCLTALAEDEIVTTVGEISVPGNGTAEHPYLISTEEQLLLIADSSLPNALTALYQLQNDITLTQESWLPIGYDSKYPFSGTFNGNGHTISGINVEFGYGYSGFFGVSTGTILHLRVDVTIDSGSCSGGLVAKNEGTIQDCFSSGTISSTGDKTGGLIGWNFSGTIDCCGSDATVSGNSDVGGLIGQHQAYYSGNPTIVYNSYAQGDVTGNSNAGGLVGRMYATFENIKPVVENCYASGIVNNGKGGGLLGSSYGTYYNSYYNKFNTGNQRGFGVNVEELKDQSTFYLWDFEYKWAMDDSFPYIQFTVGSSETIMLDGSGTMEDPYLVKTEQDLRLVQGESTDRTLYYHLVNDIELTAKYWTPLSVYGEFNGVFNGNGHTISGLRFSSANYDAAGLFGYNNGTIKNLTVTGDISATSKAGMLVGENRGIIENCFSSGSVTSTGNEVGGLVGLNFSGKIRYCGSDAEVSGNTHVGGLVGQHEGYYTGTTAMINDCYAHGTVTGNSNAGGLVGHMYNVYTDPIIRDCYATGVVNNGKGCGLVGSGYNHGRYYNSYYNSYNAGNQRGFAVSLEELTQKDTFCQWNFDTVWEFDNGYPYINVKDGDKTITFEGNGTKEFPYLIQTEKQLLALATERTNIGKDVYYRLENDITLTAKYWTPIGLFEKFQGIFDGNGHTVSNLNCANGNYQCVGLFSYNEGTIKNLSVSGNISAISKAGMLVGENRGIIENCFSSGNVTSTGNEVGGLVGLNFSGKIRYCGSDADVSGNTHVGGLVGQHEGYYTDTTALINDCYAQGDVTGNSNAGGLVGHMYRVYDKEPIIRDCYATGIVNNGKGCGLVGSGYNHGWYYNSYYNSYNTGNQRGFAVTLEELANKDTFYQWNFDSVWAMDNGYPYIQLKDVDKTITFEGNGTQESPYLIKTEKHLYALATDQAKTDANIYYRLENDIALTAKYWSPIGAYIEFKGVFNGNGHTISNLKHSNTSLGNVGFFGKNAGTVKNLTVKGNISGKANAGLLAGTNSGLIENCLSYGSVTSNGDNAGGLVGSNDCGTIHTSGSFANVNGQNNVGGLVGYNHTYYNNNEITNCFAHGNVSGNSKMGGLIGYHYQLYGTFLLQYNYAISQVTGNSNVKGFLNSYNYGGTITLSDNYYNSETSGCTDTTGATPKTTLEMKTKETYQGWNFETIWAMEESTLDGYPFLENVVKAENNSMDAGGISFWLTLNGNTNTGTVYAGMYDTNGTLNHIVQYPASKIVNVVFEKGMTGAYVKIMWWNDNFVPMCPPQTIPLQ